MEIHLRPLCSQFAKWSLATLTPLLLLLPTGRVAHGQTAYTWTSATTGGTWSTPANWTPNTAYPGSTGSGNTDTATLSNATANRIITYDAGASGYLGTLNFTQTSAFNNQLTFLNSAQISSGINLLTVTNSFSLAASNGGTSTLFVDSYGAAGTATSTSGGTSLRFTVGTSGTGTLTIGTGGVLELLSGASASTTVTSASVYGNVIVQGGTINADRGVSASSVGTSLDTINQGLTMTAGTINLSAANSLGVNVATAPQTDNRLTVNGNFQATGGTINQQVGGTSSAASTTLGLSTIYMGGSTNFMTGVTFNPGTTMELSSAGAQSFYSNVTLNNLSVRSTSTAGTSATAQNVVSKTFGAANANGTVLSTGTLNVGQLQFDDRTAYNGSQFVLGSNVTVNTGALLPTHVSGNLVVTEGFDMAGHTLDLTQVSTATTDNGGIYAPVNTNTAAGGTANFANTTFVLTSSAAGGVVRALGFDLSQGGTTGGVNVTGSVTLQSTGGAGTANNLGGSAATGIGALAATSTFLYSGSATASNPATLVSNRTIGALQVQNGYLTINQSTLTTGGSVNVSSGGTLDLNGTSQGMLTLTSNQNFVANSGTLQFSLGSTSDQIIGSGTGTFSLTNSTLALTAVNGFSYSSAYTLFNGFSSGTATGLTITGYDTADYTASFNDGVLSFTASVVPEPSTWVGGLLSIAVLFWVGRRRAKY